MSHLFLETKNIFNWIILCQFSNDICRTKLIYLSNMSIGKFISFKSPLGVIFLLWFIYYEKMFFQWWLLKKRHLSSNEYSILFSFFPSLPILPIVQLSPCDLMWIRSSLYYQRNVMHFSTIRTNNKIIDWKNMLLCQMVSVII